MARKSKRPPKRSSPTVKYAAERAAARSAGRDPEAVEIPAELGTPPAGMSKSRKPPSSSAAPAPAAPPATKPIRRPKAGRPTRYGPPVVKAIVKMLEAGLSFVDIAARPFMPSRPRIYAWQDQFPAFRDICARAHARGVQAEADSLLRIADAPMLDKVDVMRAELRIKTRMWRIERMDPKRWGNRVEQTQKHEVSAVFLEALKAITPEPGEIGPPPPPGLLPPGFKPRAQSEDAETVE